MPKNEAERRIDRPLDPNLGRTGASSVGGASADHIHDLRYFTEAEHIATSAGAADAGKPIVLDAGGQVDATMVNDADINLDNVTEGTTNKFYTATEKTKLAGIETAADVTDAGNVGPAIHGSAEKATIHDNDEFGGINTEAANVLTWWKWSTLKTALNAIFARLGVANTFTKNQTITSTDTAGSSLDISRNLASGSTDASVVKIAQQNSGDDQPALELSQASTSAAALEIAAALAGVLRARVNNSDSGASSYASYQMANDAASVAGFFLNSSANNGYAGPSSVNLIHAGTAPIGIGSNNRASIRLFSGVHVLFAEINAVVSNVPQGKLHAHDGTMGFMIASRTAIVGTAQVLVYNGAGDVVRGVIIRGVAYNNTPGVAEVNTGLIAPGGTADVVIAADTLRFAVAANGELSVIRQAGAASWTIGVTLTWL